MKEVVKIVLKLNKQKKMYQKGNEYNYEKCPLKSLMEGKDKNMRYVWTPDFLSLSGNTRQL